MKRIAYVAAFCFLFTIAGCAKAAQATEVVVFKIGQADAILLFSGAHTVLIDAGEKEDGEEILEFLKQRRVEALDMMIITHFDKDHVGGADTVLAGIPVHAVYDADYESKSKQYLEYLEAIEASGVPRYRVASDVALSVGELKLLVMPTALLTAGDNDRSLVIHARDAWHGYLLMGDAEDARIEELLAAGVPDVDVIKMPHHGRYHQNLSALLDAAKAGVAVITDSEKNPAAAETLLLLNQFGTDTYQTQNGNIHIVGDEVGITVSQ